MQLSAKRLVDQLRTGIKNSKKRGKFILIMIIKIHHKNEHEKDNTSTDRSKV